MQAAVGDGLTVGLLGPVELRAGDRLVAITQPGLRVLLAALALSANWVVPTTVLIDALWQEAPSRKREQNLHARVYQLRRLLAGAEPGQAVSRLVTVVPGYRLDLAGDELDLARFRRMVASSRARVAGPADTTQALATALGLWRGPALGDVAELSPRLEPDAMALEDLRLAVTEDWAGAAIAAGRAAEAVGELIVLVARHPLRERLRGLLMTALHATGRQADALETYRNGWRLLDAELGIQPGTDLRQLHDKILRSDPGIMPSPEVPARHAPSLPASPTLTAVERVRAAPRQLPAVTRFFAGREAELKELGEIGGEHGGSPGAVGIAAIVGSGGIGKSMLALHWAHQVSDRYPDGQLYLNLHGYDPSREPLPAAAALAAVLEALGIPVGQFPRSSAALAGLYQGTLSGRRTLLLLDNARDSAQVRALIPASAGSLVLVTSRDTLTGLAASHGSRTLRLRELCDDEARQVLAARLGLERLATAPDAVARLIAGCGGLPLALAVIAARGTTTPGLPLDGLAAELGAEQKRLDALETGDHETSLRSVLSCSYQRLSEPARELLRLLAVHPGTCIGVPAAASAAVLPPGQARRLLAELVAVSLLAEHAPGRYVMHDLIRAYAAELTPAGRAEGRRDRGRRTSPEVGLGAGRARRAGLRTRQ
jgi:DNA-binding SARP family transcriptional activator